MKKQTNERETAAKHANGSGKGSKKKNSSALSAANKGEGATERVKPTHSGENSVPGAGVIE